MWLFQAFVVALRFWFPDQESNPGTLHWEHDQGSLNNK